MILLLLLFAAAIAAFLYWQSNDLVSTVREIASPRTPKAFDGFTIVQISDLHNKSFGKDQRRLMRLVREAKPDLIAVTGDLVDARHTNLPAAESFVRQAVAIAPTYFITGNHDIFVPALPAFLESMQPLGLHWIDDRSVRIERGNAHLSLTGVSDMEYQRPLSHETRCKLLLEKLVRLVDIAPDAYNILLIHRPELVQLYQEAGYDLALSGHAHGGQMQLPFVGGVIAPQQGFFPKYTRGLYRVGRTSMIVSRGLGNSAVPIRVFNRPEVVVVKLFSRP